MAPEQSDRTTLASIGPAADVWGIGVTMYQAASKALPFPKGHRGGRAVERWPQLIHEPTPMPPKASPRVADVVMRCLHRDPALRPSPRELFDLFDDLAAERGRRPRRLKRKAG
jgi:serine/threonine-protein kinase